jgi:hypothetical protein
MRTAYDTPAQNYGEVSKGAASYRNEIAERLFYFLTPRALTIQLVKPEV